MAQAKRSPILGYNHNIKYRGVIFHVQTEDSGQQNPHLFTHLFHEGVIVSTRKLVYDAGSNEDAIKSLMQAQHKAVMKDLKRGLFDDKIDQYLGGTPGLEPRQGEDAQAASARPRGERAKTEATPPPEEMAGGSAPKLEIIDDELSEPIELPVKQRTKSDDRTRPIELPMKSAPPAPSATVDAPTALDDMAAAVRAANAQPPPAQEPPPVKARTSTAQRGSRSAIGQTPPSGTSRTVGAPAAPVIDITEDEISSRLRAPRDTAVEMLDDVADGVPARAGDSIPPATTPVRADRPAAHNAAALPPNARPAMSPPVVARTRPDDSEAAEIYQPAPPSVEPPPGERAERAGTYSVSRKSGDAPIREKTGRIAAINPGAPIPAGLGRPGPASRQGTGGDRVPPGAARTPTPQSTAVARPATPPPTPPARPGTPQPVAPRVTAPIANRTSTPVNPQGSSGVVMTRPAVVVGAPPKTPTQPARVRKAREDEGRGFGQGLISEKSLDEVILAYLSEDADEK